MACDILDVLTTTVASEFVFSVGGKVIDKTCAKLLLEVVEALMITDDWIESKKKKSKYL